MIFKSILFIYFVYIHRLIIKYLCKISFSFIHFNVSLNYAAK